MPNNNQDPKQDTDQGAVKRKIETSIQKAEDLEGQTTRDLLEPERDRLEEIRKFQLTDLSIIPEDGLVILIQGYDEPIIVEKVQRIVLGRDVRADDFSRVVDLAKYEAMDKGISRKHAMLASVSGIYYLNDMASTNGTWLNGNRLMAFRSHELKPGDWVKLGNLQMRIYFRPAQEILTISLTSRQVPAAEPPPIFTPQHLAESVAPYLVTVAEIQEIVDEVAGTPKSDIVLRHISGPPLTFTLVNGAYAIRLIREHFEPWAAANQELINTAGKKQEEDEDISDAALKRSKMRLAQEMLRAVKPGDIPKEKERVLVEKLAACITTLMNIDLKLAEAKSK
jgi:hypothetical protein